MVIESIQNALSESTRMKIPWREDCIPDTDIVRTFTANPRVYSEESDLENMLERRHRNNSEKWTMENKTLFLIEWCFCYLLY